MTQPEWKSRTIHFNPSEAARKIGCRVKTLREFSGVPAGTTGTVIRSYGDGNMGVDIQWNLPNRCCPLVDGFSKDEYEEFLVEIGGG